MRSAGSKRSSASAASASGEAHNEHVATLDPNILQAYDIIHSVESSSSALSIDDVNVSSPSASESVNFKVASQKCLKRSFQLKLFSFRVINSNPH